MKYLIKVHKYEYMNWTEQQALCLYMFSPCSLISWTNTTMKRQKFGVQ